MRRLAQVLLAVAVVATLAGAAEVVWPTPNRAFAEGRPISDFVQPTESGLAESGLFGCVRTSGHQFHEGLDLMPVARDRRGEPLDAVFAILPGVVRHVNLSAGSSNYGRYVVIEHTDEHPAILSLYAHLESIAPEVRAGARIEAGQTIGIMGHTASGYAIPRSRAHVHVEVGVWLSRRFQDWYDAQAYKTRNEHGPFNGMNIASFDLLDFIERQKAGEVKGFADYLARQPAAATVVVRSRATPDFVVRYPELLRAPLPDFGVAGWRVEFTWFGLPKAWWPLSAADLAAMRGGANEIVFHDAALLRRYPCQSVVRTRSGAITPGPRLRQALEIVFGGR